MHFIAARLSTLLHITLHIHRAEWTSAVSQLVQRVSIKNVPLLFLNNSMKHWPIMLVFCSQHHEETGCKWQ